jgi:hypothetical protein
MAMVQVVLFTIAVLRKFKDSGARNSGASDVGKYQCHPIKRKYIGVGDSDAGKVMLKEPVQSSKR